MHGVISIDFHIFTSERSYLFGLLIMQDIRLTSKTLYCIQINYILILSIIFYDVILWHPPIELACITFLVGKKEQKQKTKNKKIKLKKRINDMESLKFSFTF